MPERLRRHHRAGLFRRVPRVAERGASPGGGGLPRLGEFVLELVLTAQRVLGGTRHRRTSVRRCARPGSPACRACGPTQARCAAGHLNRPWPRCPGSWSTTALTTCTLAMPPLPIHILCPSMIQSLPSTPRGGAQVRTSLPLRPRVRRSPARQFQVAGRAGNLAPIAASAPVAADRSPTARAGITTASPIPAQPPRTVPP